jgi:hypothetical protein
MGSSQMARLLFSDGEAGTVSFLQQLRRAGLVKTVVTTWLLLLPGSPTGSAGCQGRHCRSPRV